METTSTPAAVGIMTSHIISQYRAASHQSPLFVLFQGPQGAGKTYLCSAIANTLRSAPNNLSIAILSIDDLYLPHDGLVKVAKANPSNPLLQGRGQPGTHDMDLGRRLFEALKRKTAISATVLPVFDKSLFGGEGDRAQEGVPVMGKMDVVLVEGWCTGFYPLSQAELTRRYEEYANKLAKGPPLPVHTLENVADLNENLKRYAEEWWPHFSVFIQIAPLELAFVHEWRLQQEHNMKAKNGGRGMTDEQVKAFVDRYLPGYYYFSDGVDHGYDVPPSSSDKASTPWAGRGLRVVIDKARDVVRTENF